jgi:hypothetical protein
MGPDGKEIDGLIAEILKRGEFSAMKESGAETQVLGQLLESMLRAVQALVGNLSTDHPWIFVGILIAGAAALASLVWWGARGAARRSFGQARTEREAIEILRGDPKQLRSDAEAHAAEGRFLDATRLVFRATIIEQALREGILERLRDAEAFRRARTYRELVEEFSRNSEQTSKLKQVAERIEVGLYAGASLSAADFEEARRLSADWGWT